MNETTIYTSLFLEFISANQLILTIGLVVFFAWFIVRTFRWRRPKHWWAFWPSPSLKIGWALMIFALGDAINRGLVWYARHLENDTGTAMIWTSQFTLIAAIAAGINAWGGLCALRVAAPDSAGEKPWLIVLVVAMAFSFTVSYGRLLFG